MNRLRVLIEPLTRSQIEALKAEANFTADQECIFDLLNRDALNDDGVMLQLHMPEKRYYEAKRTLVEKVKILIPIVTLK